MRIAIVGGCQTGGLARCTKALLNDVSVESWHVGTTPNSTVDQIVEKIGEFDVVISQVADGSGNGLLEVAKLKDINDRLIFLPTIVFGGFHPDLCAYYGHNPAVAAVKGPLADCNSSIIIAAYNLGLPAERVPGLFNTLVFSSLGYFDNFEICCQLLNKTYLEHGYDLSGVIEDWLVDGAFMYTHNHPHIRVLGTLARKALLKAGLSPAPLESIDTVEDDLSRSGQWPIHPDLAKRINTPAQNTYRRSLWDMQPGDQRDLSILQFVHATYDALSQFEQGKFFPHEMVKDATTVISDLMAV